MAFFQDVRAVLAKSSAGQVKTDYELDHAIRQIISGAVSSEGVVDIFTAAGLKKPDISILSDDFLAEVQNMPQRNLAVELLEKLLKGEIRTRLRRNIVQSKSFADMLEQSLRRYVFIAQETEVPFRLDESGTVSCGGVPGISNTFASALWGVSYLTEAMRIGAAGINLEGNPTNCLGYTPVCAPNAEAAATGELEARPEWYALLLARSLLGESPLRTIVAPANRPNVVASAFRAALRNSCATDRT